MATNDDTLSMMYDIVKEQCGAESRNYSGLYPKIIVDDNIIFLKCIDKKIYVVKKNITTNQEISKQQLDIIYDDHVIEIYNFYMSKKYIIACYNLDITILNINGIFYYHFLHEGHMCEAFNICHKKKYIDNYGETQYKIDCLDIKMMDDNRAIVFEKCSACKLAYCDINNSSFLSMIINIDEEHYECQNLGYVYNDRHGGCTGGYQDITHIDDKIIARYTLYNMYNKYCIMKLNDENSISIKDFYSTRMSCEHKVFYKDRAYFCIESYEHDDINIYNIKTDSDSLQRGNYELFDTIKDFYDYDKNKEYYTREGKINNVFAYDDIIYVVKVNHIKKKIAEDYEMLNNYDTKCDIYCINMNTKEQKMINYTFKNYANIKTYKLNIADRKFAVFYNPIYWNCDEQNIVFCELGEKINQK